MSLANAIERFLPESNPWPDEPEGYSIWITVFRVYKVPYDTQIARVGRFDAGPIHVMLTNENLPYPEIAYGFDPLPDGSVRPRGGLLGWNTTSYGNLLLLLTPLKSDVADVDPEVAVRHKTDSARAIIVAILGLNAAFERVCEFSFDTGTGDISRRSPALENPTFHGTPNIGDTFSWQLIKTILEGIDALEVETQNRVLLSIRWFQRALGDERVHNVGGGNVDTLLNYWIALETLVRVGEQKVAGTLIKSLANIHNLATQEIGQKFPISKVYERRKSIVHTGDLSFDVSFELQQFLTDVFVDILALQVMSLATPPRTQKYLDGRAYGYL